MSLAKAYSGMKGMGHSMSMAKCSACKGDECMYAEGGKVGSGKETEDFEKGVHKRSYSVNSPGTSEAGYMTRQDDPNGAPNRYKKEERKNLVRDEHKSKLSELKEMPNPKLQGLAEGGEVEDMDSDMGCDDEIMDQCCGELLEAIHSKNKKEILESLKAIIMSMKG